MELSFEFRIARRARDIYHFDEIMPTEGSGLRFSDIGAARLISERIYAVSGRLVPASEIYAMGLIDEIMHLLIRHYEQQNPGMMSRAFGFLQASLDARLDDALVKFTEEFPPTPVYLGHETVQEYLFGVSHGTEHRLVSMEEMLLVNIANQNPALEAYRELFDDSVLGQTAYRDSIRLLGEYLARQPGFGTRAAGMGETLLEVLIAPAKASPYSLEGQLQFLMDKWGAILGEEIVHRILRAMDLVREEVIRHTGAGGFSGSAPLPDFSHEPDYERYSPDRDWMPRLVLIAKNAYVWLEQLSRKHQRWIKTLDQIPDEDLDLLASRGFTGLWLIGLWERSRASQGIKQRMGQNDAVASAYSLYSYDIASDLGGWEALTNLRGRAWQRGLRLSADMVPNHMGIDSAWVIEHPDWFLSLDHVPYPSYSYSSENLADDQRVGIYLEDHYYDQSDAAVVFQRRDHETGDSRYIYHGNDGTSFPWNDTAQLNYTRADVREAVIQTILHVARNFPIIRFDAAMTLAKKHIQRLWFPEPGAGGAIPSRAEHGMTKSEFDAAIPNEFWREVVDRVAAEIPDTLLLAEAFWLMEGYFVRTLGMHRVYNSAFMHMLRDEDNAKYRQAIKSTLEFDSQILKRYVNFMNNPDEKTAVEQFGNGDKYFGVCTLLSTLPGLPMFGHGQIEGFREKYGMEFRKPKWDETSDDGLIRGHEWKIFPLLRHRYLFADVEHFLLYDLFRADGHVDENVFAYSNRFNDERGLVIYHNRFAETRGWIKVSSACLDKGSGKLLQESLGEGLALPKNGYAVFQDYITHQEYIRSCAELWEKGLYVELGAYQHHVFMDWRFVEGSDWKIVNGQLNGAGTDSMQAKWDELFGQKKEGSGEKPVESGEKKAERKKRGVEKKPATTKKAVGGKKSAAKIATKRVASKKTVVGKKTAAKTVKKTPAKTKTAVKKAVKKTVKSSSPRASKRTTPKKSKAK